MDRYIHIQTQLEHFHFLVDYTLVAKVVLGMVVVDRIVVAVLDSMPFIAKNVIIYN